MKRKISILLIISMCFMNFQSLGVNSDDLVSISYNHIENLVLENNKTIMSNDLALQIIKNPPGTQEAQSALFDASQGLTAIINMVNSAMFSIDLSAENANLATDYNIYVALTACKTALQFSKSDLDSQMSSLNGKKDEEMESTEKQFDAIKQQLVWATQSIYMAYLNIDLTLEELNLSKEMLVNTITMLEKRYELGQISILDLENAKIGLVSINSAIETLRFEQAKILYDFNILIGRDFDTTISISYDISPDTEYIRNIDIFEDFNDVLDNNYNYYSLTEAVDSAYDLNESLESKSSQANYDMAVLNRDIERQSMMSSFMKIYNTIYEKMRLVEVEKEILENKQLNLDVAITKYDLGLISLDALKTTQNEYDVQKLKITAGNYNLFVSIEQYKWAMKGMITG